jgi:CRP-like cAMP-binding protein
MAGFIDAAVQDIDNRLKQLRDEEQKLQAARVALTGAVKRGPGRPPRSGAATTAPVRRGRRPGRPRGTRGGNTRSNQALELVRSQPGITIPQIAESLRIEPNYLYRIMPKLTSDGLVKRDGQGWHAAAGE